MLHGVSILEGRKGNLSPEESEKGNPGPEGSRTPRTDTLHQEIFTENGTCNERSRSKPSGRRIAKIKKCESVYITSPPVIRHHKMPSRKKPFPFRWTRKGVWTPAQI
jgi:hypothetical protein